MAKKAAKVKTKKPSAQKLPKPKPLKIPKTLGACADRLYELKQQRLEIEKVVKAYAAQEKELTEHLILNIDKSDATGVRGNVANAGIVTKTVATVSDWDKFYKHILKTKDFSLMQRRANDAACRERWEDKQMIPGVAPYNVLKVSLTKI